MKEELLNQLQGKWMDIENEKTFCIEITGIQFKEGDNEIVELDWNDRIDKWVIPGGLSVRQLSITDEDQLLLFSPDMGSISEQSLLYRSVK